MDEWETDALDASSGDEARPGDIAGVAQSAADVIAAAQRRVRRRELAPVDHSATAYPPFVKDLYVASPDVAAMTPADVAALRARLDGLCVRPADCPAPVTRWAQCGLPPEVLEHIDRRGWREPTAVQAQTIPAAMAGRDVLAIARTGSGKTAAFVLPMLRHVAAQWGLSDGTAHGRWAQPRNGPQALVLAPTRELAMQTAAETRALAAAWPPHGGRRARVVCVYGGASIAEQIASLRRGCDVLVATPGRLIDLLLANSGRVLALRRTTLVVLDEADRMFDMGFGPQVVRVVANVRPDRQTLLLSATFPPAMDSLARRIVRHRPVEVVAGLRGAVGADVAQVVVVVEGEAGGVSFHGPKFAALLRVLGERYAPGTFTLPANGRPGASNRAEIRPTGAQPGEAHTSSGTSSGVNVSHSQSHVSVGKLQTPKSDKISPLQSVENYARTHSSPSDMNSPIHLNDNDARMHSSPSDKMSLLQSVDNDAFKHSSTSEKIAHSELGNLESKINLQNSVQNAHSQSGEADAGLPVCSGTGDQSGDAKSGLALVFVDRQETADALIAELTRRGYHCNSLHGGKDQDDRDAAIADFRTGTIPLLVATSVAARGLDVRGLGLVVNYDVPGHAEDYVHRVGRTGRAGERGVAVTLFARGTSDERHAAALVAALRASGAHVPPALLLSVPPGGAAPMTIPSDAAASGDTAAGQTLQTDAARTLARRALVAGFGGRGLAHISAERERSRHTQRVIHGVDDGEDAEKDAPTSTPLERAVAAARAIDERLGVGAELIDPAVSVAARLGLAAAMGDEEGAAADETTPVPVVDPVTGMQRAFSARLDVNDYPTVARQRALTKASLSAVAERTGAYVSIRGTWTPASHAGGPWSEKRSFEGRSDRLHVHVEGPTAWAVSGAIAELRRVLAETTTEAVERGAVDAGRYGVL